MADTSSNITSSKRHRFLFYYAVASVLSKWRSVDAFTPSSSSVFGPACHHQKRHQQQQLFVHLLSLKTPAARTVILHAGGFAYEDPEEQQADFENPFNKEGESLTRVDPARLLGPRLQGTNLYFVGIMGCGKSAVGDHLARRMGTYNFLDTDKLIETATGMKISEIFEKEGEDAFRNLETQVLDQVKANVRCIVSTGGGAVIRPINWSHLQTGIVVWIDVDPEVIIKRIQGSSGTADRPLLHTENPLETLQKLLDDRRSKYEQADVQIKVTQDMNIEDAATTVLRAIHEFIDKNPPAWQKAKSKAQMEGLDWVK